jgi:hypothetical protein
MSDLKADSANQYNEMVTKALERLTRWAFPDSQVERKDAVTWQLWHMTDEGKKYVDVSVELQFKKDRPVSFWCDGSLQADSAKLTREGLDNILRICICSIDE